VSQSAIDRNGHVESLGLRDEIGGSMSWFDGDTPDRAVLRALMEALPVAIYATDASGKIVFYNREAVELWGGEPVIGVSEWCGPWNLFWPDGSPMALAECPMAVALSERRTIKGAEAIAQRKDGTLVRFLAYPTPLYDRGELIGAVDMLVEVTEREQSAYFAQRLATIVECSQDAIISKDLSGTITTWNPAAERLFGYSAAEAVGRSITMLIPPGRLSEETAILDNIRRGERVAGYETVRQRKDGSQVDISLTISPLRNASGKIIGASKIARDITERKRAQQYQSLLLREMSHRVKNLLAIASGLVGLSARSAPTPQAMAKAVRERLGAYARAHELTRPETVAPTVEQRVSVLDLIQTITSPYVQTPESGGASNIDIDGPEIVMNSSAVPSLALALHEFTTNAAKYGALSTPEGCVRIAYRLKDGNFELMWRETGGPSVPGVPDKSGFGTLLVGRTVQVQLGGKLDYEWLEGGVAITLRIPIERLAAAET
jgi:PAS domain S-box-containing protein